MVGNALGMIQSTFYLLGTFSIFFGIITFYLKASKRIYIKMSTELNYFFLYAYIYICMYVYIFVFLISLEYNLYQFGSVT